MRQLTAKQKKIVKAWVDAKVRAERNDRFGLNHTGGYMGDPASMMIDDGTYQKLEEINDTEILYTEINRFANDYYEQISDKAYASDETKVSRICGCVGRHTPHTIKNGIITCDRCGDHYVYDDMKVKGWHGERHRHRRAAKIGHIRRKHRR